eukprot:1848560-Prymnesium_polylepis.1
MAFGCVVVEMVTLLSTRVASVPALATPKRAARPKARIISSMSGLRQADVGASRGSTTPQGVPTGRSRSVPHQGPSQLSARLPRGLRHLAQIRIPRPVRVRIVKRNVVTGK